MQQNTPANEYQGQKAQHRNAQDVMQQVAPVLVRDCLTAQGRLSLFCASKVACHFVVQHASCTQLTLEDGRDNGATMQLACEAVCVALTMRRGLTIPPRRLWQRLVTLVLEDLKLSPESFEQLTQLGTPVQLLTLRLERCDLQQLAGRLRIGTNSSSSNTSHSDSTSNTSASPLASTPAGRNGAAVLAVRTLQCIECKPDDTCVGLALSLIDKAQLQQLQTNSEEDVTAHLETLPQLKRLHADDLVIKDQEFQRIISHPSLTHVTIYLLFIRQDFSSVQPVSLQEIVFTRGCSIDKLAALPLAGLHRCTLHRSLEIPTTTALSRVMQHQDKIICDGLLPSGDRLYHVHEPSFELVISYQTASVAHVEQAIRLCTATLEGALVLPFSDAVLLAALPTALPTTITTIKFQGDLNGMMQQHDSFINLLPDHVEQVVLAQVRASMAELQRILSGVTRRMKIKLGCLWLSGLPPNGSDRYTFANKETQAWFNDQIRGWLASYPNHVEVEVDLGCLGHY